MDRMKNAKDQKRGGPSGQGGPPNKRSFEE
jgi:hypothetical protein